MLQVQKDVAGRAAGNIAVKRVKIKFTKSKDERNRAVKLVFLGPPGAGKGTQAVRLCEEMDLEHASTGDIFRAAVKEESELGKTVKSYLDGGKLVPDELTSRVVDEMVLARYENFVLDGFPRTIPQAESLEDMLEERDQELDAVIYFELDQEDAVERLTGRLVCSQCGKNYHKKFMPPKEADVCDECGGALKVRSDSSEEVVKDRLEEYEKKTAPLVPYYSDRGLLRTVDAGSPPDEVTEQTRKLIQQL